MRIRFQLMAMMVRILQRAGHVENMNHLKQLGISFCLDAAALYNGRRPQC